MCSRDGAVLVKRDRRFREPPVANIISKRFFGKYFYTQYTRYVIISLYNRKYLLRTKNALVII